MSIDSTAVRAVILDAIYAAELDVESAGWDAAAIACAEDATARVADVLAPVIRAERAAALDEAAAAEEARCTGDWQGITCDTCRATAKRLTARAEAERRGES